MTYEEIMRAWKQVYNGWFEEPMKDKDTLIEELQSVVNKCDKFIENSPLGDESDEYAEVFELDTKLASYIDILKRGDK